MSAAESCLRRMAAIRDARAFRLTEVWPSRFDPRRARPASEMLCRLRIRGEHITADAAALVITPGNLSEHERTQLHELRHEVGALVDRPHCAVCQGMHCGRTPKR